jgi:XXXCH domain-containing protein
MSGDKRYFEDLTKAQLAEFFRGLADQLAGQGPEEDAAPVDGVSPPDPGEFKKLKLSVKRDLGGFSIKWKSKALYKPVEAEADMDAAPADEGEIKYKKLKKRMKESFKMITESLMSDVMPGEAVVTAFLQDSKRMTSFPEKGAEFYNEYDKACMDFARAFEAKNLTACKSAATILNQLKKDCHSRYK